MNNDDRLHIALFSPCWPPEKFPNGIVTYVSVLANELMNQGHRVSIITTKLDGNARDDIYEVKQNWLRKLINIVKYKLFGFSPSIFDFGEDIANCIVSLHKKNPIDVVEMEESFGWVADVSRMTKLPTVCKLHGPAFLHMVEEELHTAYGKEKVEREGLALKTIQTILSPSRSHLIKTIAKYHLTSSYMQHVNNPMQDLKEIQCWELRACDHNQILYIGRFDKIKGADIVIKAFQKLLLKKPQLKLIFAGPDSGLILSTEKEKNKKIHFHEYISSFGDVSLTSAIKFLGRISPQEAIALRNKSLATLLTSRIDNQPYTAIEAMLQKCPFVCTDTSGLGELVVHEITGLKARAEDSADLAVQIQRIIDDPLFGESLGIAARNYVLNNHSPEVIVNSTLEAYKHALSIVQ